MQPFYRLCGTTLTLWALLTTASWAETQYISDQLVVSLRAKPQNSAEPIQYLRTDTAVEIIEEVGDFIKVKTAEGEIGFIKQHYLTSETPKSTIIKRLQKERDRLASQASDVKNQLSSARAKTDQTQQELEIKLNEVGKELQTVQKQLQSSQAELEKTSADFKALQEDAQNVITITKERDQLQVSNEELAVRISTLEEENSSLMKTGVIKWFLAGGGVLFFGWIIGKASGGRRRRSSLY